jgi:hydroxypyruvate isomerase
MRHLDRRTLLGSAAALAAWRPALAQQAPQAPPEDTSKLGKTPHTRFAVNVEAWWPNLEWLARIEQAAAWGYSAVEIWPWRGRDLDKLEATIDRAKIEITQFTGWGFEPGMNDPKNHDAVVAEIEASCKTADRLRVKKMCVVGGNDQPGMTKEEMHANIITALKRCAPIAESYDVTLVLEPMNIRVDHKGHCLYGSPDAVRICREVGSTHVKILWDLYHMHISEGDLCGHLREGFDQLGYVQLADHPGRHEPGTGEIHYNRVLKELHDLGYTGHVGLECWPIDGELVAARRVFEADQW